MTRRRELLAGALRLRAGAACARELELKSVSGSIYFEAARTELDARKRAAIFVRLNDIVCDGGYLRPLINRKEVAAVSKRLVAPWSGWALAMSTPPDRHRNAA